MPLTLVSPSNALTLEEATARLAADPCVEAVVVIGSASRQELTPASDYDLWVILNDPPVPLQRVHTYIDGRLTDINFLTVRELEWLATAEASGSAAEFMERVRALRSWKVLFDRTGRVRQAEQYLRQWMVIRPAGAGASARYRIWFEANYRLLHTRRLLLSTDPSVLTACDLALHEHTPTLLKDYFRIRELPWPGNKDAVRYLSREDPAFLAGLHEFLAATDRAARMALYEHLVRLLLAPAGDLWEQGVTAMQFAPGTEIDPDLLAAALEFWLGLVAATQAPAHGEPAVPCA
jgi:predicted nucleotidyltransferase